MRSLAKINWSLRIVGRRDDGYHLIESIFLPTLGLFDEIEYDLQTVGPLLIKATGPFANELPLTQQNLMAKALDLLGRQVDLKLGGTIRINKKIPVAAGLGGGSSNAATILTLAQEQLHNTGTKIPQKTIVSIATQLGADVPFFLNPTPSLVKGIGEQITPISHPIAKHYALLITPNYPIRAQQAYQIYKENSSRFSTKGNYDIPINDLEDFLCQKYISLQIILEQLREYTPRATLVSGSGPTCIAIFDNTTQGLKAKKVFSQNFNTILTKI
jgi:4-diphosphocytidyl-2-C-methyl-D-erythritol kinase